MTTERKPHLHAEVIKAWADGHEVQYRLPQTDKWEDTEFPTFCPEVFYRVKPEPKKPTTWYQVVLLGERSPLVPSQLYKSKEDADRAYGYPVIKLIPVYTEENPE